MQESHAPVRPCGVGNDSRMFVLLCYVVPPRRGCRYQRWCAVAEGSTAVRRSRVCERLQVRTSTHGPEAGAWLSLRCPQSGAREGRGLTDLVRVRLRQATASADGFVRIYEAVDVMNLSHWPLQVRFACAAGAVSVIGTRCRCASLVPRVWVLTRRWRVSCPRRTSSRLTLKARRA